MVQANEMIVHIFWQKTMENDRETSITDREQHKLTNVFEHWCTLP